jgi:DNA-binding MurR/RpiR family transcriptional regulator
MPELTATETRITEILLRGDGDPALPLKEVAREAEVSEAMVVKTAKRLGFNGYKDLRAALQAYRGQPNVDLHQDVTPEDTPETIVQKVFRTSIQALEETTHMMAMSASLLRAGDVVVAFSHSGRTTGVVDSVQIARANRASIIAVTNYASSPLADISDVVLCSTARGSYLTSENATARIAQLNIMDAIFIAVAQQNLKASEAILAKTMTAVSAKRKT